MPSPIHIILADDDFDDCLFFKEALEELTIPSAFTMVHNGDELMEQLLKVENVLPDVLFLDLNMPRKNGFECLAEIKGNDRLSELPVVIISTSFEKDMVNQLYESGAYLYIKKPSAFSDLKNLLKEVFLDMAQSIISSETGNLAPLSRDNFMIRFPGEARVK